MSKGSLYNFFVNCSGNFDDEPIDNYLGLILIWFLLGVIVLLVLGTIFMLILSRVQDDDSFVDEFDDEEKQLHEAVDE